MRRVVIAHPMNLGDVVTALPIAGVLKRHFPAVEVLFCATRYAQPLVECCTHIDGYVDAHAVRNDADVLRVLDADVFINPYPCYALARSAHEAGIPIRVGNLRRPRLWPYCNRFVIYSRAHSRQHTVDIVLKNLRALGIVTRITQEDLRSVYGLTRLEPLPDELASLADSDRFNLILHPKSGSEGREWPAASFAELIARLPQDRYRIFLTGVPREAEIFRAECRAVFGRPNVVDLMGQLSLKQFVAVAARMDGIVASGTGPLHIAAALGIHALGIYPPTPNINALRWAPVGPRAESIGLARCPAAHRATCTASPVGPPCPCTQQVSPSQVARVVQRWNGDRADGEAISLRPVAPRVASAAPSASG